jgi:hypothetical protein
MKPIDPKLSAGSVTSLCGESTLELHIFFPAGNSHLNLSRLGLMWDVTSLD